MTSTVLFVDGEPFLITEREKTRFVARRLDGRERDVALKLLDDAHAEASAILEPRAPKRRG